MFNFAHGSIAPGGYKEGGISRGCYEAVLPNYTQTKAVHINTGIPCLWDKLKGYSRARNLRGHTIIGFFLPQSKPKGLYFWTVDM